MSVYLQLLAGTILLYNIVLIKYFDFYPSMLLSQRIENIGKTGFLATLVVSVVCSVDFLVNHFVLNPMELNAYRFFMTMLTVVLAIQIVERVTRKVWPNLYRDCGFNLYMMTILFAILGMILTMKFTQESIVDLLTFSIGIPVVSTIALVLFAALVEHVKAANVPLPFQGRLVAIVTAGIISLGFFGVADLVKV